LYKGNPDEETLTKKAATYEILFVLAKIYDAKSSVDLLKSNFNELVNDNESATNLRLKEMLQSELIRLPSAHKLISVLKCFQMDILIPAMLILRESIYTKGFPFKEVRGFWKIRIEITGSNVIVTHLRKEQSHDRTPENYFEFDWSLVLTFDKTMSKFDVDILITDW